MPDSAVEPEVMSKEQTFRSEDMPFGIANGKSQIAKYGICNLRSEIPSASEDSLLQVYPSLTSTAESGLMPDKDNGGRCVEMSTNHET
jgi:hypothetical protein